MDQIAEVMTRRLPTVCPHVSVDEAARLTDDYGVEHLLVLDGDHLVGIISAKDLQRCNPADFVFEHMRSPVWTISANSSIQEAAELMSRCDVGCLPVVAGGLLLGLVTRSRLLTRGQTLLAAEP